MIAALSGPVDVGTKRAAILHVAPAAMLVPQEFDVTKDDEFAPDRVILLK